MRRLSSFSGYGIATSINIATSRKSRESTHTLLVCLLLTPRSLSPPDAHLLNPSLSLPDDFSRPTPFHNYLDEFLSAIRIFGFLEKPVFHELSRHLQTKRLIAGDTITISLDAEDRGEKSFYCVLDGNVQVFTYSGDERGAQGLGGFDAAAVEGLDGSYNGYQLLNEVSTGGTLSSLFTILSLFTEDVKLSWEGDHEEMQEDGMYDDVQSGESTDGQMDEEDTTESEGLTSATPRQKKRADSDVSQLDFEAMGGSEETETIKPADDESEAEEMTPETPVEPGMRRTRSSRSRASATPTRRGTKSNSPRPARVIARATVDTTLAVIPSFAFKRLRHKFPKATGQIVSVILTRFARVTFMTAHKYLGLTKEVLQAEDKLNSLVSYPLPIEFYDSGGMDGLRSRFKPEVQAAAASDTEERRTAAMDTNATVRERRSGHQSTGSEKDYFSFAPDSPKSTSGSSNKSSLPSITPRALTPSAATGLAAVTMPTPIAREKEKKLQRLGMTKLESPAGVPAASRPGTSREVFKRGTSRKQVGAGDLLSMTSNGSSNEPPAYRPGPRSARTPGLRRMDTWLERPSFGQSMSTLGLKRSAEFNQSPQSASAKRQQEVLGEDFDLRDAVMISIAESIGLIQSTTPESTIPSGSESQGWSTPTSPNVPGGGARSAASHSRHQSRSPFGNLSMLDMLQGNNTSNLSFKDRMTADDESSVTGTTISANGRVGDLENDVQILYFKAGSTLVGEGETNPGLFFVIDGFLDVSIPSVGSDSMSLPVEPVPAAMNEKRSNGTPTEKPKRKQDYLFTVKPGGIAGYLASLCGTPSYTNVTAKTDCYVGLLPHNSFERLLERRPIVLLTLAKRLISLLSPLIHDLDLALDWEQINAGQVLYREGDKSDSFYIVINGRLRAVHEQASGKVDMIAEYGQGSPIGELEAITDSTRPNTVHAIRDSELVKMPMTLFNAVSVQHPATTIRFLRLIASRVKQAAGPSIPQNPGAKPFSGTSGANLNLKTVCILPVTGSVPIAAFAERLRNALEDIGAPTAYLNQASVMRQLGRHAFSKMGKLKIAGWLAEREQRNRTVLYVVDTPVTSQWTLTAIRQVSALPLK